MGGRARSKEPCETSNLPYPLQGDIMSNTPKEKGVYFSKAQLAYLESIYPTRVLRHDTSESEVRHYFGTQEVLTFIKSRVRD